MIEESTKAKVTAREAARLERQRKLAETLRQKADAEDRGEDIERQKNWEYTIEENDQWEKKLAKKARRADFSFNGTFRALSPARSRVNSWMGRMLTAILVLQMTRMPQGESTRRTWTSSNLTWRATTDRKKSRLAWLLER